MAARSYTQSTRAEATKKTREAILDAAIELVRDDHLFDPPLEAVAAKAGVTTRTVLRHFGSKDALTEAAIVHGQAQVTATRAAAPGDVPTAVRRLVEHYEQWGDTVLRLLAETERHPRLREITDRGTATHLAWVDAVFAPFLDGSDAATRRRRAAVLATVCDVHTWGLLRRRHGLSQRETETAILRLAEHATESAP